MRYLKSIAELMPVLAVIAGGAWWAALEAADNRYVQLQQLAEFAYQQRVTSLQDQIDDLQIKVEIGEASNYEKAKMKNLVRKLEQERSHREK